MNKTIFFFVVFLVFSGIQAQEPLWRIYPLLGVDMGGALPIPLSNIPDGVKGYPNLKWNIGLGGQLKINDRWNVGLDVNYHHLSFSSGGDVISVPARPDGGDVVYYYSGPVHTDVDLKFVEFPLMGLYSIGENWKLIFGGYYSSIINGKFVTQGNQGIYTPDKSISDNPNLPGPQDVTQDYSKYLSNYDLGVLIGYQYKIASRILFWGRMHFGLKSIFIPGFEDLEYEMYQVRLSTGISYVLFRGNE